MTRLSLVLLALAACATAPRPSAPLELEGDQIAFIAPDEDTGPTDGDAPECEGIDTSFDAVIFDGFQVCAADDTRIAQTKGGEGFTCLQVCCAFGHEGCVEVGGQADYNVCDPAPIPGASLGCDAVFNIAWSSECRCF
jgi:hypothetical protein